VFVRFLLCSTLCSVELLLLCFLWALRRVSVCQARLKSGTQFLSCRQKSIMPKQTNIEQNYAFCWWYVFDNMCAMGRWSLWSCFDVKLSTLGEDMRRKRFLHFFVPSNLDIWPFDLRIITPPFASIGNFQKNVNLLPGFNIDWTKALWGMLQTDKYHNNKAYPLVSIVFLFRENRRHGTDRQTDGLDTTINAAY